MTLGAIPCFRICMLVGCLHVHPLISVSKGHDPNARQQHCSVRLPGVLKLWLREDGFVQRIDAPERLRAEVRPRQRVQQHSASAQ
eukprot:15449946-Alexandrium_andersonii.AAC.1